MSRHFIADAYQRLIEDSDVQNTQLYPCKHAIVEDLQTGRPVFLVKRGIPRHDSKAKTGMVEMVPSFPAGASLMHLDGVRVCIGVTAGCTMSVIFPSVGGVKLVHSL